MARTPQKASKASQRPTGNTGAAKQPNDSRLDDDPNRRSVIITFKPKDQRPDSRVDKLEIVADVCKAHVTFFDAESTRAGGR